MEKIPCRGGEKMNSITKSVSCDSCGNDITVLNIGKDPELPLCLICTPWVNNSLDYSPHKIAGVTIDDLELFRKYRSITKGINIPNDDYSWNLFICAIVKANGDNNLLEEVQQDYQTRLKIHPELRDFLTISWSEIPENDVLRKTYSDVDIVNDIISVFKSYEIEQEYLVALYECSQKYEKYLSTLGKYDSQPANSSYFADFETAKKNLEGKLYKIQSITIPGKIIGDALRIETNCISREFIIQLLYDYVKSDQSYSFNDALNNVTKSVTLLDKLMDHHANLPFKRYPNSPLVLEILSKIISGEYCKNSQYSLLSVIANNNDCYDQSCNYYHRDRKIWQKSFQLLEGVIRTLTISNVIICNDGLKVRGKSGRWYLVEPREGTPISQNDDFVVTTLDEGDNVCIHMRYPFRDMPLGDQLASLVMTLYNDKVLFDKIDVRIDPYYY